MATSVSNLSSQRPGRSTSGGFKSFWRDFFNRAFNPYRPELHYMRGPGPACRAKQAAALRRAG